MEHKYSDEYINKQMELLCKKLKAHSVSLVCTPCNHNVINPRVHEVWRPWQVIVRHIDENRVFSKFSKTAQEAVNSAIKKTNTI